MGAEHLPEGIVQQVSGGMVAGNGLACLDVDLCHEGVAWVGWHFLDDVYWQVVLTLGVDNLNLLVTIDEPSLVAHLTTHLGIEWSGGEHHLVELVLLLHHMAVAQYLGLTLGEVVAHKLCDPFLQLYPVAGLHCSGIACALFLLSHLGVKLLLVDRHLVLLEDELSEVEREAVGVI